jgi:hypothetical protein
MANTIDVPSSLTLRSKLEDRIRKDLLGPAGGPGEIIDEPTVRDRYIVGLLAPKGQSLETEEYDELALDGTTETEDGKPSAPLPQSVSMLPSSIGLTFTVDGDAATIQITARWGRYQRVQLENQDDPSEKAKRVWQRIPVEAISEPVPLKVGSIGPWSPDPEIEDVYVRGLVRRRDGSWTVTLYLINAQEEPKRLKDEAWVFQPELIINAPDSAPIFIKRSMPPELGVDNPEDRRMAMLYRKQLEFAVGHGVAIHADLAPGQWERAVSIRTRVLPVYEVERMEAPTEEDIPELADVVLDMGQLAEIPDGEFANMLQPLATAYESWIQEQEAHLQKGGLSSDLQPFTVDAANALDDCREALARMRAGIEMLDENTNAAEAFRFANRAMALQRVHTVYARDARQGKQPDLRAIDVPHNRSWRPFQLAFILLNLPGLVDPAHPDRSHPSKAKADLLWFPTGGGKTEAYLGVAAFAMGMRRLQGEIGGRSGLSGVTVLMRYTLRLLTLQQFQRAAALMCACEVIRREDPAKWGPEPFRIGLWVGQRSTPNWTKDAAEIIRQDHQIFQGSPLAGRGTPHQLTNCPWCGKPIDPGKNIRVETYENGRGRTFQYCSDQLGQCPFSFRQSPDEGLPIVVVDEEIYRRLPTLLIATVDKFAQMPWKGETQMLFGRVNSYCPRHGYRSPDVQDASHHPKRGRFPAVKTQEVSPLRPPDLIIQDELHLISGPLGTLVGLYETAVDQLSSWELDGKTIYPKIIASTATIRRARDQVYSLFLREVKIFPPPGLEAEDNFFSRRIPSSEETPGRRYLGVCAPGKRLKAVLIRVYAAHMAAAQALYEKYGQAADPWMTLVGYFNSMRELGGMRRVVDDTLRSLLMNMADRGLANRYIRPFGIDELTSRKGGTDIPKILDRLEAIFDPALAEARKKKGKTGKLGDFSQVPLDVVLATNMISVGVDVGRLGTMIVASQPKATAEYIQATSRVGRAFPGLVCTVYNWARPRDLSHYERFEHYHATFYQQVEAMSVTPFSPRALDRGLSAVLVAYLRLLGEEINANEAAGEFERSLPAVELAMQDISRRASLVDAKSDTRSLVQKMLSSRLDYWLNKAQRKAAPAKLAYKKSGGLTLPLLNQPTEGERGLFTCLNSLRDVEPGVALVLRDYGMDREPGEAVKVEEDQDAQH